MARRRFSKEYKQEAVSLVQQSDIPVAEIAKNLGIRVLMKRAGSKSQTQLAGITGVSQTQIGYILGQKKAASIDLLECLAIGLDCESWMLLTTSSFVEEFGYPDFTPLLYCYARLNQSDQIAVLDMTHDLYEAENGHHIFKT